MKKKFLVFLSAFFIFGLVAAAFAYSRANNTTQNSAASCPMMQKQSASTGKDSCGMADCCKDGSCPMGGACCKDKDSCPMKQNSEAKNTAGIDMSKVTVVGNESGDSCCQPGADCCKGGACCHKKS